MTAAPLRAARAKRHQPDTSSKIDIMGPMTFQPPGTTPPPPRDSARTDEIRKVAADLFQSAGYSSTTMNEIAKATGILPGSLYHHFASKEEIAIEIMEAFNRGLTDLAARLAKQQRSRVGSAQEELRRFAAEATAFSFEHGAAIRLRAYEAPTVATSRLREAMDFVPRGLGKVWNTSINDMLTEAGVTFAHRGLLRYALLNATLTASMTHEPGSDAADLARRTCDLLLTGASPNPPSWDELDASPALRAAEDAIARWKAPLADPPANSREAIMLAARSEFARRGYSATTIRDVANAAGIRMGTLYRRVDSKEQILSEILGDYSSQLDDAVRSVLGSGSTAVEGLDGMARLFITASRRFREESEIVKLGWIGREADSNPFRDYYLQTQKRLALWEKLFEDGQANGSIRPVAPPQDLAIDVRTLLWIPFRDHARTSEARAHEFLRCTLLRGALTP
ncbi:TetR family transcriptional regulator [Aeromicrobium yanjiei]|uniref:TetR family transcriptional regulator n=2 Tax=Aeromicrobium yanjiei TaxID=2662028 RepID=A0A5Q2MIG4_9ACTN|nr:TetR family transcriptional regulator [Aeromicrobium yanjiei]